MLIGFQQLEVSLLLNLNLMIFFLTCVAAFTEDTNPVPVCSHVKSVIVAVGGLTVSAATFVYNSDLIYDASFT